MIIASSDLNRFHLLYFVFINTSNIYFNTYMSAIE